MTSGAGATPPRPSRRRFLMGGALFSIASFLLWQLWGRRPLSLLPLQPGDYHPKAMTRPGFRTLEASYVHFLDDDQAASVAARHIDGFLRGAGKEQAADVALGVTLLELFPGGLVRTQRFSRLSRAEQREVLRAWERSDLFVRRMIVQGLRQSARFAWFSLEANWPLMDYDGPWVGRGSP